MVGLIHVSSPWVVPAGFTAEAVTFDKTNDFLDLGDATALSGPPTNNKLCSFSCWLRPNGLTNASGWIIGGGAGRGASIAKGGAGISNQFKLELYNSANSLIAQIKNTTALSDGSWYHIMGSVDLADTGKRHLYFNNTDEKTVAVYTNDTIEWDVADAENAWQIGNHGNSDIKWGGDLAEVWLTNEYIDLSVEANRAKFYNVADDIPVDLGSDGSTPTGTAPLIYFTGNASVWNAGTNAGSGGNFTMTGAVADSSNEPVDAT